MGTGGNVAKSSNLCQQVIFKRNVVNIEIIMSLDIRLKLLDMTL